MKRGRAAHRQHHEPEDHDPEHAEDRAPGVAALHERVQQHRAELGGQQDRGRFPAGEGEHTGKLAAGPVAIGAARNERAA